MRQTGYQNSNISQKAKKSMEHRAQIVFIQKCILAAAVIVILSLSVLLGTSIKAFAGASEKDRELHAYYTSIEVQQGDTLWEIADTYMQNSGMTVQEYMDEICRLNHIADSDSIHEGGNLVIPYYTYE